MKRCLMLFSALCLVVSAAQSQRIMIVTDAPEIEVAGAGNLCDFLRGLGYTVDADPGDPDQNAGGNSAFRDPLTESEENLLESYDLVIVHRSTGSGSFAASAIFWNELEVPLLLGSSYIARNNPVRWNWVVGGEATENSQFLAVSDESHPIYSGVTITDGFVDLYNQLQDVNYVNTGGEAGLGNGKLIAETELNFGTAIAAWDADGSTPVAFQPGGVEEHSYRRVFFALMRYFEDDGSGAIAFEQYSENGLKMIANAVEFSIYGDVTGRTPTGGSPVQSWSLY
jgi:hypothetical protein